MVKEDGDYSTMKENLISVAYNDISTLWQQFEKIPFQLCYNNAPVHTVYTGASIFSFQVWGTGLTNLSSRPFRWTGITCMSQDLFKLNKH